MTPATMRRLILSLALLPALDQRGLAADLTQPIARPSLVFEESGGIVAVEAEHFYKQTKTEKRSWHITSSRELPDVKPDGDPGHVGGASGGAYVECLPDTRRTHDDKLIPGDNFSNTPGALAVLHYKVNFQTPGRYYVWARAYSAGPEDNGLHVGLDGQWPESGRRLQWCEGKNGWRWESKQRTEAAHCGEPHKIHLDVATAGEHELMFSMREDGFEFDRFLLTTDRGFARPDDAGPVTRVKSGTPPVSFPLIAAVQGATRAAVSGLAAAGPAATEKPPGPALVQPRQPDGSGDVAITGELRRWHKVTLTLDGPFADERDNAPNPFTDYALNVTFVHESGSPRYSVPGYFAADGEAANTSAGSGTKWRAHLSPDKAGEWTYSVSFVRGRHAAVGGPAGAVLRPFDGKSGGFSVGASDKSGRDFRGKGRLRYVGRHHLQFAGSKEYFLKAGADAPETLLAYVDFDGTEPGRKQQPRSGEAAPTQQLKKWEPHLRDWKTGDPTWKGGGGKGLIGALNYLAGTGANTFSFLPYNAGGDGDNVWPFIGRAEKLRYDCSKLDQWGIVFDHATALGLHLHFKLQENEMDDNRRGLGEGAASQVPESLDGGKLGPERRLYCRELIARFGHALALNWNIGEENTQSTEEVRDMVRFIHDTDPYRHNIVIHTYPNQQDKVYTPLLGDGSLLTGVSLQNSWRDVHQRTLQWVGESAKTGRPWIVANDEQNSAALGVPPDIGYKGHDGVARVKADDKGYTLHDIRKLTLWGNLMAGGAGVEYYFGYQLPENDLVCEDWRSRDGSWEYCRIALEFFQANGIPFWDMKSADALIGNPRNDNSRFCLAKPGSVYLVYLPEGGTSELDLTGADGSFGVTWFNPRTGGELRAGSVKSVRGGGKVALGAAPSDAAEDWAILVRR